MTSAKSRQAAARRAAMVARHAAVYRMRDAGIKRRVIAKSLNMPLPTVDYLLYGKAGNRPSSQATK